MKSNDYSAEIQMLTERIEQLNQIRDILYNIDDTVCSIEQEVSDIDNSLPNPKRLTDIKDPSERKQLTKAENLLKEAYAIIDELLGNPEDEATGQPSGTTYMPEAKGSSSSPTGPSIDEILSKVRSSSKNKLS